MLTVNIIKNLTIFATFFEFNFSFKFLAADVFRTLQFVPMGFAKIKPFLNFFVIYYPFLLKT